MIQTSPASFGASLLTPDAAGSALRFSPPAGQHTGRARVPEHRLRASLVAAAQRYRPRTARGRGQGERPHSRLTLEDGAMHDATRPLRTRTMHIRLTEEEYAFLLAQAEMASLTFSSYGRAILLGHRVVARADSATISELRRLGGLVKLVHNESRRAYSAQTKSMLDELKAAITRLARQ